MAKIWTEELLQQVVDVLSRSETIGDALGILSEEVGVKVSPDAMRKAFQRNNLNPPSKFLATKEEEETRQKEDDDAFRQFCFAVDEAIAKKQTIDVLIYSKRNNIDYSKCCEHIESLKEFFLVDFDSAIGLLKRTELKQDVEIERPEVVPCASETKNLCFAVISDLHFGSDTMLVDCLKDFMMKVKSQGIKNVFIPGDVIHGIYRHSQFEQAPSIDSQLEDLVDNFPWDSECNYYVITGNHDQTFTDRIGLDVGKYTQHFIREKTGMKWHHVGNRCGVVRLIPEGDDWRVVPKSAQNHAHEVKVRMWHPSGGGSYAKSYKPQKYVEELDKYSVPTFLLIGHYHKFSYTENAGVKTLQCPTFEGGQSNFGKTLIGEPEIGGLIVSAEIDAKSHVREFNLNHVVYREDVQYFTPEPDSYYPAAHRKIGLK